MNSLKKLAEESGQSEEALMAEIIAAQALDGLMDPSDIADLYLFLASSGGANITGQAINIDRGEVMS
jgi:3-hydroxybutyrate dehydrogenase